ncbi:MAG: hypothetical protein M5U25_11215 [Planctomycetota bacterium]|nr:hypothetical protein [Planctomycetota bacterium]
MNEPDHLQPYGHASVRPGGPPVPSPEVEPGRVPSGVIWAYLAIAGTFLCPPFGLFAGIYALSRAPNTRRARNLAITAIIFSGFALLYAVTYILNGPPAA